GVSLFTPNKSQFIPIDKQMEARLTGLVNSNDKALLNRELQALGLDTAPAIDNVPLRSPPLHAISLAISQKCNMGCMYCYAEQGSVGGVPRSMSLNTAITAIDALLEGKKKGDKVQVSFLGGEPLMNRKDIME